MPDDSTAHRESKSGWILGTLDSAPSLTGVRPKYKSVWLKTKTNKKVGERKMAQRAALLMRVLTSIFSTAQCSVPTTSRNKPQE